MLQVTSSESLGDFRRHSGVKTAARLALSNGDMSSRERLDLSTRLLANDPSALASIGWGEGFTTLGSSDRYYLISALYMLLMPQTRRRKLAAYFTPPHLCEHVLARLAAHGFNAGRDRVLDPASGGAAFLVPTAELLRKQLRGEGGGPRAILEAAQSRLRGVEIEPGLAKLSELLLADVFKDELAHEGLARLKLITRRDALSASPQSPQPDVVISNPPYGRVFRPSPRLRQRWSKVISDGHVNTYSLFIALALEHVRPGGLVAMVVPTSFLSGPYFLKLRSHILESASVLELSIIEKRSDEFMDVVQDTCVLVLRKNATVWVNSPPPPMAFEVTPAGVCKKLGHLEVPKSGGRGWALPSVENEGRLLFSDGFLTLEEYGYSVRTGYFVWNRSADRLSERTRANVGEVPLVWAHNIKPNEQVAFAARPSRAGPNNDLISFAAVPENSPAIQRGAAILLQRTTNRSQKRRLVAGYVSDDVARQYGGFVSENHTVLVAPKPGASPLIPLLLLMQVLNSKAVDDRYRRLSGTVSISVKVLRSLPLPNPTDLARLLRQGLDLESAIEAAYGASDPSNEPSQADQESCRAENLPAG